MSTDCGSHSAVFASGKTFFFFYRHGIKLLISFLFHKQGYLASVCRRISGEIQGMRGPRSISHKSLIRHFVLVNGVYKLLTTRFAKEAFLRGILILF